MLRAAEPTFDALITTDKNLRYQQNLKGRRLAILLLPTPDWRVVRLHGAEVATAVAALSPGDYVELLW